MRIPGRTSEPFAEAAYLFLRLGVSFLFVWHAPQKMFGWWSSPAFPILSLRGLASSIEIVSSIMIALGWHTSGAALVAAVEMIVAYCLVHRPIDWLPIANRGELSLLYFCVFVFMAVRGSGTMSLDQWIETQRREASG